MGDGGGNAALTAIGVERVSEGVRAGEEGERVLVPSDDAGDAAPDLHEEGERGAGL